MGDLHLEPGAEAMAPFLAARAQLAAALASDAPDASGASGSAGSASGGGAAPAPHAPRVVQVGDLGGYTADPGSTACFLRARDFLAGFGLPATLVLGNHDLEGAEFETDEANLAAWQQVRGEGGAGHLATWHLALWRGDPLRGWLAGWQAGV